MKAYIESFSGERYIADVTPVDNNEYQIAAMKEIRLSWRDEPIATVRCRDIGSAGIYRVCEITDDEIQAIRKAETEKAVKELDESINQIEKELKNVDPGTLPTYSEARAMERKWNNTYNEGGEGYVPHYMDIDEYNRLIARRADLVARKEALSNG